EHLAREVQDLHARIEQENVRAADADELIVATSRAIRECTDALGDVNQRAARTASLAETVKAAEEQIPELDRRRRTYEAQLARAALAVDVDVDALYERKTRLAIEEAEARAVQTRLAEI